MKEFKLKVWQIDIDNIQVEKLVCGKSFLSNVRKAILNRKNTVSIGTKKGTNNNINIDEFNSILYQS